MVFCYQNCSDLLWEKIVLAIEKNFWNSRLKTENLQKFWDHYRSVNLQSNFWYSHLFQKTNEKRKNLFKSSQDIFFCFSFIFWKNWGAFEIFWPLPEKNPISYVNKLHLEPHIAIWQNYVFLMTLLYFLEMLVGLKMVYNFNLSNWTNKSISPYNYVVF